MLMAKFDELYAAVNAMLACIGWCDGCFKLISG